MFVDFFVAKSLLLVKFPNDFELFFRHIFFKRDEDVSINEKKRNFVKLRILATGFVWQTQKFVEFHVFVP